MERKNQEDLPRNRLQPRRAQVSRQGIHSRRVEIMNQSKEDCDTSVLKTWKMKAQPDGQYS